MNIQLRKTTICSEELSLSDLVEEFADFDWFGQLGRQSKLAEEKISQFMKAVGVSNYTVEWITRDNMMSVIENMTLEESSIWQELKEIPSQLKKEICQRQQENLLENMADTVLEAVFHPAFKGAYEQVGEKKVLNYLVGNAMYMSILASGMAFAGKADMYESLTEIVKSGHTVLGLEGNTLYLV